MIPDLFLEVDAYIEETDFIGTIMEVMPPKWVFKTYEYTANGMLTPKDINNFKMEKMETEWTLNTKSSGAFKYLDMRPGETKLFTLKCATADDTGQMHGWVHRMEVNFCNLDLGGFKSGEQSETKIKGTVEHYEMIRDGEQLGLVTAGPPAECILNGVDMLAELNEKLGRTSVRRALT